MLDTARVAPQWQTKEVEALLNARDIEAMTGGAVRAATLNWYRHVNDGRGPKWFKLGPRKVVYKRSDVIAWLDAAYAASPAEDGKASA